MFPVHLCEINYLILLFYIHFYNDILYKHFDLSVTYKRCAFETNEGRKYG